MALKFCGYSVVARMEGIWAQGSSTPALDAEKCSVAKAVERTVLSSEFQAMLAHRDKDAGDRLHYHINVDFAVTVLVDAPEKSK